MKKLVLIDSHALIHRGFHALPMLTSPKGVPTNAVYGFTTILLKMISNLKPDYIAAAFDLAGPTFRHEQFEAYKAHREKAPDELYAQIPIVKNMVKALGVPIYEAQGFEADDVIGSLVEQTKELPDLQVMIVTGDLDTLQLIDGDRVTVFTLKRGMSDTVSYNERAVKERFGLTPVQLIDYKGLKGDPSDNIPGVPGVGDKTASALIGQFKTLEKLYTALEKKKLPKGVSEKLKAKLLEYRDQAFASRNLSTIVRTVDIDLSLETADWHRHLDTEELKKISRDLGFFSLVKRLDKTLEQSMPEPPRLELSSEAEDELAGVTMVTSFKELPDASMAAVHVIDSEKGFSSICISPDGDMAVCWETSDPDDLRQVLERYPVVIAHGAKRLLTTAQTDMATAGWFDTRIAAWLIWPDLRDVNLDRIAYDTLEHELERSERLWVRTLWRLKPQQEHVLETKQLTDLMRDIELPLISVLNRMQRRGIRVDPAVIQGLSVQSKKDLFVLQKKIWKHAGEEFNINSPQQLGVILFDRLGIKGKIKKTAQGAPSTAAGELEKIREEHPVVDLILQWRELSKLASTYIEPFPSLIAADGRVHTTYNQTGTATGRLSSQDPNLQNIPARTELGQRFRAAFVPRKGFELVSLDYSQLELRIVAHMADDTTMKEAFSNGEDIHARTASVVFGIPLEQVTTQMRRQAKVLNFGIIYGMGVLGFARAAGVSRTEARQFMDEYFARFTSVARYMEDTKKQAAEQGYVSTLLGRRRPLPDMSSGIPQLVAQAERMAINHPVQGTGADIMKIAMLHIEEQLANYYPDDAYLLLQVHDEVVLEIRQSLAIPIAEKMRNIMGHAYELSVPLTVDVKRGPNWSDMTPLKS